MMDFKYNGQSITGESWKRANSIIVYNEYGQTPRVMFIEEKVVEVEDGVMRRPAGELNVLVDAEMVGVEFPILLPDGTSSGQNATVGQLAALLTSAYVHFAELRDYEETQRLNSPGVEPEEENDTSGDEPTDAV